MKKNTLFLLVLVTLFVGCTQESSTKKSSSSSTSDPLINCAQFPYQVGCSPTTGGTTSGTTGGGGGTTNPYPNNSSAPLYPNWGVHYPGGEPSGTCSATYAPAGITYTPYETRKGTITLAGLASGSITYTPNSPEASNYLNTSAMLKSVTSAKNFFMTDALLKFRIKVKPQPDAAQSSTMCFGRNMPGSTIPGYTKLQYNVVIYRVNADNSLSYLGSVGPLVTGVNSCSPAIDLSSYKAQSPDGLVVAIDQVKANQNCWWNDGAGGTGFTSCNAYKNVRSYDCWSMDFEVAADGTKIFD